MSELEKALPTYKDFIAKYGKRPADIVFAVTQLDTVQLKDAEIVQAVKAERERILRLLPEIPEKFEHNKTCFYCIEDIRHQALKNAE